MRSIRPTAVLVMGGTLREGQSTKPIALPPAAESRLEAAVFVALGIDPHRFTGIAPLETMGRDIPFAASDYALRCDLLDPVGRDLSDRLYEKMRPTFGRLHFDLVHHWNGAGLLVHRLGWPFELENIPPARARLNRRRLPRGQGDEVIREIIETSQTLFGDGQTLWPWGGGSRPDVTPFCGPGMIVGGGESGKGIARLIKWSWRSTVEDLVPPSRLRHVVETPTGFAAADEAF